MSEIVRADIEASRSLGLDYFQTMRKVVLPQAIRTMLPSDVNQFIISIKDTSFMSMVGLENLKKDGTYDKILHKYFGRVKSL